MERALHRPAVLAIAAVLIVAVHAWSIAAEITPVRAGGTWDVLWGPDSYSRLTEVRELLDTGAWYDDTFHRSNAPYGTSLQWSRLVDAILIGGGAIGSIGTDTDTAIRYWGIFLGPVLHLLAIFLLSYATRPFLGARGFLVLVAIFASLRALSYDFFAAQIDHHALQDFFVVATMALLVRHTAEPQRPRLPAFAGVLAALAVWASPEMLTVAVAAPASLGILWVTTPTRSSLALVRFSAAFLATVALALILDRAPSRFLVIDYDRLSLAHLGAAIALALAATTAYALEKAGLARARIDRVPCALAPAAVAGLGLWLAFPMLFAHPYATLDPYITQWHEWIQVEQPLWPRDPATTYFFLIDVGPAATALVLITWSIATGKRPVRERAFVYAVFVATFLAYTGNSARGVPLLGAALVFPLGEGVAALGARGLGAARARHWPPAAAWLALALGALVWHLAAATVIRRQSLQGMPVLPRNQPTCSYRGLAPFLSESGALGSGDNVLAPVFDGPELLYRTDANVVGTPMHRNVDGLKDTYAFFSSVGDDATARGIARDRRIALVVLCRDMGTDMAAIAREQPRSLLGRLFLGMPPSWLERVPLPNDSRQLFDVYRVRVPRGTAPRGDAP